ncbi:MAG: hypothetical protein PHU63_04610 [Candidatus ainarchaeum sp.]|nr:hypothetical protein [Candidatus ainarchaeum sp.]
MKIVDEQVASHFKSEQEATKKSEYYGKWLVFVMVLILIPLARYIGVILLFIFGSRMLNERANAEYNRGYKEGLVSASVMYDVERINNP